MIVLLWFICGMAGAAAGLVVAMIWGSAALLFGFSTPTPDQVASLIGLLAGVGVLGSALFTGAVILWSEILEH